MANEEIAIDIVNNEDDKNNEQPDSQPTLNFDAEQFPKKIKKTILSKITKRFKKKTFLQIHVVKTTIYDLSRTVIFQTLSNLNSLASYHINIEYKE